VSSPTSVDGTLVQALAALGASVFDGGFGEGSLHFELHSLFGVGLDGLVFETELMGGVLLVLHGLALAGLTNFKFDELAKRVHTKFLILLPHLLMVVLANMLVALTKESLTTLFPVLPPLLDLVQLL